MVLLALWSVRGRGGRSSFFLLAGLKFFWGSRGGSVRLALNLRAVDEGFERVMDAAVILFMIC